MSKVSVITPIYNQEKYLEECLQSLLNQTFTDFEVILINDGSNDNSETIAKSFIEKYSNFKYFHQDNRGVSVARNRGIEESQGEYLYFLDSDDTLSADFLESVYKKAINNNADFVVCGEADWAAGLETPPCVWTGSIFVKKTLIEKYQVKFPVRIQPCEDGLFSHFCLAVAEKVCYMPEAGYFHRDYETSHSQIVKNQSNVIYEQLPKWLNIITDFYNKNDLWNDKALHLAMFIQKEPFSRYINNEFCYEDSKELYKLLYDFYKIHIKNNETKDFKRYYSNEFKQFISSRSFLLYALAVFINILPQKIFSVKNEYWGGKKKKIITIMGINYIK